jgi:hypothetical protein
VLGCWGPMLMVIVSVFVISLILGSDPLIY